MSRRVKRFLNWENGPMYLVGLAAGLYIVGFTGMVVAPGVTGWPVAILGTVGAVTGVAVARRLLHRR